MKNKMPLVYLLAMQPELASAFAQAFSDAEDVKIAREDFASFMDGHPEVTGIVSPANSFGLLTGGLDKALRDYFGKELQDAVRECIKNEWFGEQTLGTSMAVDIPGAPGKKLLHTPTMRTPSKITDDLIVYSCMRSALMAAIQNDIAAMVIPAFGGGSGQLPMEVIAHHMRLAWDQIAEWAENPHVKTFRTTAKVKTE